MFSQFDGLTVKVDSSIFSLVDNLLSFFFSVKFSQIDNLLSVSENTNCSDALSEYNSFQVVFVP